jgi:hypothetical protein
MTHFIMYDLSIVLKGQISGPLVTEGESGYMLRQDGSGL